MTVVCLAAVCLFQLLLQVGVCWKSEVVSLGFSMMLYARCMKKKSADYYRTEATAAAYRDFKVLKCLLTPFFAECGFQQCRRPSAFFLTASKLKTTILFQLAAEFLQDSNLKAGVYL